MDPNSWWTLCGYHAPQRPYRPSPEIADLLERAWQLVWPRDQPPPLILCNSVVTRRALLSAACFLSVFRPRVNVARCPRLCPSLYSLCGAALVAPTAPRGLGAAHFALTHAHAMRERAPLSTAECRYGKKNALRNWRAAFRCLLRQACSRAGPMMDVARRVACLTCPAPAEGRTRARSPRRQREAAQRAAPAALLAYAGYVAGDPEASVMDAITALRVMHVARPRPLW